MDFNEWLTQRGCGTTTIRDYEAHVRLCEEHPKGITARLLSKTLAPKTKRAMLSALRSWAKYSKDADLTETLDNIRLPASVRQKPKFPLSREDWETLREEIDRAHYIDTGSRAVLGAMAVRGFRVGDLLRLRRHEVKDAIQTGTLSFEAKGSRRLEYGTRAFKKYLLWLDGEKGWDCVDELIAPGSSPDNRRKQAVTNIERRLRVVGEHAGLDVEALHPHRLRRTYAVMFLQEMQGDPEGLLKLKAQMQWQTLEVAASYADHDRREELEDIETRMFKSRLEKKTPKR